MGNLRIRKRIPLSETVLMRCDVCKLVFNEDNVFCTKCGKKLIREKTAVYANLGKNGLSSISYKLASGITLNTKGHVTFSIGKGISYTTKLKK